MAISTYLRFRSISMSSIPRRCGWSFTPTASWGSAPVRQEMKRVRQLAGTLGGYVYNAAVSAARPPSDYTARVIPHCDGVAIPLEDARILWQK